MYSTRTHTHLKYDLQPRFRQFMETLASTCPQNDRDQNSFTKEREWTKQSLTEREEERCPDCSSGWRSHTTPILHE